MVTLPGPRGSQPVEEGSQGESGSIHLRSSAPPCQNVNKLQGARSQSRPELFQEAKGGGWLSALASCLDPHLSWARTERNVQRHAGEETGPGFASTPWTADPLQPP